MFFPRKKKNLLKNKLPNHIAFIMDGNGRWAKRRGLPRSFGHNEGGKALLKTVRNCHKLGIKAVTVFAFSTENWDRPEEEINHLMKLPNEYIKTYLPEFRKNNIKINFIGFFDKLPDDVLENMKRALEETKDNTGMVFTVALNYGARAEIIAAVRNIAFDYAAKGINADDITEAYFETKLLTYGLPVGKNKWGVKNQ